MQTGKGKINVVNVTPGECGKGDMDVLGTVPLL